ncbi:sensor histidine kinase [Cetobacterium sp.]|uniref:sensor histidine kinase n=1 Tax=Cetobacterium sp. TaxID=2071632 RepID=UPI003F344F0D
MKALSQTLKHISFGIICLFIFVLGISLSITGKYLINTSKLSLRNAMSFLKFEILEESSSKTFEIFNGDLIAELRDENVNLKDSEITIEYKNNFYSETENKNYLKYSVEDKVMNINNYGYIILKNNLVNKDGETFTVTLIKNLSVEKNFFFNMIYIFMFGLIICILISAITFNHLLNKVNQQLSLIENLNSNITLENLNLIRPTNYFKEFDHILDSYEEMLIRLDEQNKKQIEFVHNSSHELKTPLFIVRGYIDMIKRWGKSDPEILNEALVSIEEETNGMNLLIEKLLFIAKESEIKSNISEIELSEVVLGCISNLKFQYPNSNITFIPEYTILESDESLIKLLIKNLLENAIKYGNDKVINISINNISEQNKVILTIEDHGIGMKKDDLNHIYDRFYRANKSRSKNIEGHGLGMSIVKRILNILKVSIDIQSNLNVGTTVHLFFNLKL